MIAFILACSVACILVLYFRSIIIDNYNKEIRNISTEEKKLDNTLAQLRSEQEQLQTQVDALSQRITDAEKNGAVPQSLQNFRSARTKTGCEFSSDWLIKNGHLSMEQYTKVLDRMDQLSMDFVSACLALGYIGADVAKQAKKFKDPGKDNNC